MKFWYKFLFLSVFVLALVGCSDDDDGSHSVEVRGGIVTQLQKHTVGKGVPIVIVCEGFSKKDIERGWYRQATNWALEGLFSVHPMISLREYFDVYEVTAVSNYVVGDSIISNELDPCIYTKGAIGEERLGETVTVFLRALSPPNYYGRSYCNVYPSPYSGFNSGSYIPIGYSVANVFLTFGQYDKYDIMTLLHEAVGHGFARLDDEYVDDEYKWDDFDFSKKMRMEDQNNDYWRNISFDSDVTKSYWADFAADSRYDFEKLGCYEGGSHQEKGVYRPTENSIMRSLNFGFDVVGRAMIYKRCMKIAYGDSWEFNYEDFVKFDLEKAKAEYKANQERYPTYSTSKRFCAPPRFREGCSSLVPPM